MRAWGKGDVYLEGVECVSQKKDVCIRKGWSLHAWGNGGCVYIYTEGVECVCAHSTPVSLQNWVWLTRLCIQTLEATTFARQRPLTKLAYRSRITDC